MQHTQHSHSEDLKAKNHLSERTINPVRTLDSAFLGMWFMWGKLSNQLDSDWMTDRLIVLLLRSIVKPIKWGQRVILIIFSRRRTLINHHLVQSSVMKKTRNSANCLRDWQLLPNWVVTNTFFVDRRSHSFWSGNCHHNLIWQASTEQVDEDVLNPAK